MIHAAIIGFGGIAQSHKNAYLTLEREGLPVKLVSVCDTNPERFTNAIKINIPEQHVEGSFNCYTDLEEMLRCETIDLVSICLPTYLHAEYTIKMLKHGCHVLCEKPMALKEELCEEMIRAASAAGRCLMVGQCVRFMSAYTFLKDCAEDGRYGSILNATFERLCAPPVWGFENWYMDYNRSGGCITDLHVHDLDFTRYLFGEPKAVSCVTQTKYAKHDSCHTTLFYDSGIPVTVLGDEELKGVSFKSSYRVVFEKAAVIFDGSTVTVYPEEGERHTPVLDPKMAGIPGELRYFTDLIENKKPNLLNPPESAATTIRLVHAAIRSAEAGGAITPFEG